LRTGFAVGQGRKVWPVDKTDVTICIDTDRWIEENGLIHETEGARGLRGVLNMHEVGPAFGPVFPGMRRGVGADVVVLPILRRPVGVVAPERLVIVRSLVSEELAETLGELFSTDEAIPVVVTDLVAEVTEQRAVRLTHHQADSFAHDVVGLGDIKRDQPLVVAGENFGDAAIGLDLVLEEGEGKTLLRIVSLIGDGQLEVEEAIDEAAFRAFHELPEQMILLAAQVGNGLVEPTRIAKRLGSMPFRRSLRNHPVADRFLGVILTFLVELTAIRGFVRFEEAVLRRFQAA
jgi:hypothetical protein